MHALILSFAVLHTTHPMSHTGQVIEHPDGTATVSAFSALGRASVEFDLYGKVVGDRLFLMERQDQAGIFDWLRRRWRPKAGPSSIVVLAPEA